MVSHREEFHAELRRGAQSYAEKTKSLKSKRRGRIDKGRRL
jgi:hypothetical protein